MRGFLATTFMLVVLQVVLQDGVTAKIDTGTGVLTKGMQRLLSPTVAGVPNLAAGTAPAAAPGGTGTPAKVTAPKITNTYTV